MLEAEGCNQPQSLQVNLAWKVIGPLRNSDGVFHDG
jgi:hypothetical protein